MTTLSLPIRLRRAVVVALLLGLWAPIKIVWEQGIARQQDLLRYRGVTMTRQLRDELGQGMTIGVLSGMRGGVADILWLYVELAWEKSEWFRMGAYINLCTSLQPRSITFWDGGGWQLAWNASVAASRNIAQPNPLRRVRDSRFWIDKGMDIYKRGIANNPEHYRLWAQLGMLYQQRLGDYRMAAYYYGEAAQRPDSPIFYERFPAVMYGLAGDDASSYAEWQRLWNRLTPEQRTDGKHVPTPVEIAKIRAMEIKLSIPPEKRVFPN